MSGPKGPEDSPFVIVGEAPGKEELIEGIPFIGPSGQVLNDALNAYFGKKVVTKWFSRPSELKPGTFIKWSKEVEVTDRHNLIFPGDYPEPYFLNTLDTPVFGDDKTPALMTQLAMAARPALLEKIRKHPRKIIIALGAVAAQALLDMPGLKITKNRGILFSSDLAEIGILATIHPAYLLRGGGSWRQFKADITYGIELAQGKPTRRWEPPTYSYVRNLYELLHHAQIIRSLPPGSFVAFDKETEDFQPMRGSILNQAYSWTGKHVYILCGNKHDAKKAGLWDGIRFQDILFKACQDANVRQVWHNGKFDCRWAHWHGAPHARVDEDTMLMSYCLTPDTKVLTTDLAWKPIKDLVLGEELVAFDEFANRKPYKTPYGLNAPGTNFRGSRVTGLNRHPAQCYTLTMANGKRITCSKDHMWSAYRYGQGQPLWMTTEQIAKTNGQVYLSHFVDTWEEQIDREAGYFAGILDGEGNLASGYTGPKGQSNWVLSFAQNPGLVLDRVLKYLETSGIGTQNYKYEYKSTMRVTFRGYRESLRLLGMFRPSRLLAKARPVWEGERKCAKMAITNIEFVGECEVVGIETETHTFIAEGFKSHNCLDEQRGVHDLETVAQDWVFSPDWKGELDQHKKKKASYQVIPYNVLFKYAAYDIANTFRLAPILRREINLDPVARKQYERSLIPASAFLLSLEKRGIAADREQILKNKSRLEVEAAPHMQVMREWANKIGLEQHNDVNYYTPKFLNSPKQLNEFLYDDLKIKNDDGTLPHRSTAADIVEKLAPHPFLKALRAYRKIHKGLSTYVENLIPDPNLPDEEDQYDIQPDGRVHATYLIHGTATGRLSSRGPNMQNIPRDADLRGQFVAGPGRMLIEADLNQAEIRSLAILSRDPELCKVYLERKIGLHDKVRNDIFGVEADWTAPQYHKYLDKFYLTPETRFVRDPNTGKIIEDQLLHEMKMIAKNVNFGIIYGITNIGLAEQINGTQADAQVYLDAWSHSFPVAWEFIQRCRMAPVLGLNLVTVFGYRKRFRVVTPDNIIAIQNEAANFPHQNTASVITMQAGIETYELLARDYDTHFVNTVHDSQLLDAPLDYTIAQKVTNIITSKMEQVPIDWGLTYIPFKSDAKWGTRWGHLGDIDEFAAAQGWKEAA